MFFGVNGNSGINNNMKYAVNGTSLSAFSLAAASFTADDVAAPTVTGFAARVSTGYFYVDTKTGGGRVVVSKELAVDGGAIDLTGGSGGTSLKLANGHN